MAAETAAAGAVPAAEPIQPAAAQSAPPAPPIPPAGYGPGYGSYYRPPEPPRRKFWSRMLSMRAVAAVTLAGVVLGGVGGAAVGLAVGNDGHDRRGPEGFGPSLQQFPSEGMPDGDGGQQLPDQGLPGQPPGLPDQVPPSTEPDDGSTDGTG
ncbi:MAG TPA: hypothetical protein VGJ41_13545 [Nocardioides sp.]